MRWARIAIAGAAAVCVLAARTAHADVEQHGVKWTVEAAGAGCDRYRPAFERELALACEAMATCRVVPPREAELVATLRCEPGSPSWWLSMRTIEGKPLSSIELTGTSDDALREGAIEVAHDVAPERTLAAEALRNTLADRDAIKATAVPPPRVSMSIGGVTTARANESANLGARIGAGYKVGDLTHLMGGLVAATGGNGDRSFRRFRSGFGVAWGAPFTSHVIGVGVEAGLDVTNRYDGRYTAEGAQLRAVTRANVYAQQTLFLQVPLGRIRPYAAFGLGVVSAKPILMGSIDVGLLFPVF